ncbi:DNA circularization N-terminal domain-containing protein [Bradyrhizobium septentrionale]|uniref:DNA circularization N-terminal domain-containing protein n=1 Tax=Bradyrhizobium septentrionale TaxID=1404411 RepID=A0A973W0E8_9BRAD|nr:DNA circularization N-terminal domain-containing protein [Bradyrhizobium septentrionale]UGY13737.1 DNA circularization N-terminal domain-containing protein [Bradyrhizobium septentrionale]
MSTIKDIKNPWRDKFQQAAFRGAIFYVESGARSSGRRVVVHTYPKRNDPYSEDMGRTPLSFHVTGFLIGPNYLDDRDILIASLEADGPGTLQMPFDYLGHNIEVMAGTYTITEVRERGGYCSIEMEFTEFGKPGFAGVAPMPTSETLGAAGTVQDTVAAFMSSTIGATPSATQVQALWDTSVGRVPT